MLFRSLLNNRFILDVLIYAPDAEFGRKIIEKGEEYIDLLVASGEVMEQRPVYIRSILFSNMHPFFVSEEGKKLLASLSDDDIKQVFSDARIIRSLESTLNDANVLLSTGSVKSGYDRLPPSSRLSWLVLAKFYPNHMVSLYVADMINYLTAQNINPSLTSAYIEFLSSPNNSRIISLISRNLVDTLRSKLGDDKVAWLLWAMGGDDSHKYYNHSL